MGEAENRIVQEIESARQDLDQDLRALEQKTARETNGRVQLRRHPWILSVGIAVAGLLVVKMMLERPLTAGQPAA